MKLRALTVCLLMVGSVYAEAPKLVPLTEWTKENPSWGARPAEATYFFARCGAALTVMAAYIAANARSDSEDPQIARTLNARALAYIDLSEKVGHSSGATKDFLDGRLSALTKVYVNEAKNNKMLYNSAFVGPFNQDIQFCTGLYPNLFK
jgi:hypothetical protein